MPQVGLLIEGFLFGVCGLSLLLQDRIKRSLRRLRRRGVLHDEGEELEKFGHVSGLLRCGVSWQTALRRPSPPGVHRHGGWSRGNRSYIDPIITKP